MKKSLLILGAVLGVSAGAFAQGTIALETAATSPGVGVETFSGGVGPGGTVAGDWYSGSLTLEVFYAASSSQSQGEINAINAAENQASANTSASAAAALLAGDTDFTLETFNGASGATLGANDTSAIVTVSGGVFSTIATFAGIPAASTGEYILVGSTTIGGQTYEGLIGLLNQPTGGSFLATPPGTQSDDASTWPGENMDLAVTVPEPASLALAGLGGLSMLFLRRRKA